MKKEIDNVNRRKFLEHSAKITAAGFLMNKLPARSKRLFSIEGEIKVALIGCGGRGTGAASQALEADPDVRLVAVADVFEDRITECLKSLNEKYPDRVITNAVKGMLPHNRLGRKLLTHLKVYSGDDHPHVSQEPKKLEF